MRGATSAAAHRKWRAAPLIYLPPPTATITYARAITRPPPSASTLVSLSRQRESRALLSFISPFVGLPSARNRPLFFGRRAINLARNAEPRVLISLGTVRNGAPCNVFGVPTSIPGVHSFRSRETPRDSRPLQAIAIWRESRGGAQSRLIRGTGFRHSTSDHLPGRVRGEPREERGRNENRLLRNREVARCHHR